MKYTINEEFESSMKKNCRLESKPNRQKNTGVTKLKIIYKISKIFKVLIEKWFHLKAHPTHTHTPFSDETEQIFLIEIFN